MVGPYFSEKIKVIRREHLLTPFISPAYRLDHFCHLPNMPRVPAYLDTIFPTSYCSTLLLLPFTEKFLKSYMHSLSPLPLLPFSLDPTPVSLPCSSSKAVAIRVTDAVYIVKVIVQVSILIQLDPSVALDAADDSLFLETFCSLGFQDTTPSWVSFYQPPPPKPKNNKKPPTKT